MAKTKLDKMIADSKVLANKIKRCEELAAAEKRPRVAATKSVKKGKAAANSEDNEEEEAEGVFSSLFRSCSSVGCALLYKR